jgi:hypothetical protein
MAKAQQKVDERKTAAELAANRPDQYDPFGGSVQYTQTGKDRFGNPTWRQDTSLGEMGQQYATGLGGLGQQYFSGAQDFLNNPFSDTSGDAFNRAYDLATTYSAPRWDKDQSALENKLRNQGLDPQSEAYKDALNQFYQAKSQSNNDLTSRLQSQLYGQGLQGRQQQLAEFSNLTNPGLAFGQQTLNPQGSPFAQVATSSPINMPQLMQNEWQAKASNYGGLLGGLGKIGLGLLTAPMTGGGSLFGSMMGGLMR